ncbi:putative quinol monooxygenase [Gryllotalpicola reticulitermitis]|uniref:Quinol monooxygenase n=1 Tax=Gryllotalpicola reticulitermitis TaxID=1184153 RepID=A0ABV8Q774_9MICO
MPDPSRDGRPRTDGTSPKATFVSINQMQPKDGQRDQLIALLTEFAVSIHAEPGCTHYSVHQAPDETGPLTIIQAYSSVEAFDEHAVWMRPNVPRLAALLAAPLRPPVLYESVPLSGNPKESLRPGPA